MVPTVPVLHGRAGVQISAAPRPIQLPTKTVGKAMKNGSRVGAPLGQTGMEFLARSFHPAWLVTDTILGMTESTKKSLSLPFQ